MFLILFLKFLFFRLPIFLFYSLVSVAAGFIPGAILALLIGASDTMFLLIALGLGVFVWLYFLIKMNFYEILDPRIMLTISGDVRSSRSNDHNLGGFSRNNSSQNSHSSSDSSGFSGGGGRSGGGGASSDY